MLAVEAVPPLRVTDPSSGYVGDYYYGYASPAGSRNDLYGDDAKQWIQNLSLITQKTTTTAWAFRLSRCP